MKKQTILIGLMKILKYWSRPALSTCLFIDLLVFLGVDQREKRSTAVYSWQFNKMAPLLIIEAVF